MRGLLISILVFAVQSLALANEPPEANAGPDQNIFTGDIAILQGSATDPDGDFIVAWSWSVVYAPDGSIWSLSGSNTSRAGLLIETSGDFVVSLV